MRKWIIGIALLWCLLLFYQPTEGQAVIVWTDKGCNSTYKPGEVVQIHYRVFDTGWTRVFKRFPDTHEEEIAGWRYFPGGGEYVEMDTLGPECGKVTYTVSFYQQYTFALGCHDCMPCYGCGSSVVYVLEVGRQTCSINVQCEMGASLFTDKAEYIAGVDSEARITLNITDVYGSSLDADSIVLDVNGIGVTAIKSSPGLYTGSFALSGRQQGEYVVTATVFKRDYPEIVRTTKFTLIVPVTVEISADKEIYTPDSEAVIRVEVKDITGRGVDGLHLEVSFSGPKGGLHLEVSFSGGKAALTDVGGGIYEARLDLSGLQKGRYTVDIVTDERYIRIDSVRRAEIVVGGLPQILIEAPGQVEVKVDSTEDIPVTLRNTGEGDALNLNVSVMAPPGIDVRGVSGYGSTLPSGGQTTALISLMGREGGQYTVNVEVSYQDVGGGQNKASGKIPVDVNSNIGVLVAAAGGIAAVGAGAYLLKGKAGAKAGGEILKKTGGKIAQEGSQKVGTKVATGASKEIGTKVVTGASKEIGTKVVTGASKEIGTKIATGASKEIGTKVATGATSMAGSELAGTAAGGGVVGGITRKSLKCKKCGFENLPDSKYCSQCGAVI